MSVSGIGSRSDLAVQSLVAMRRQLDDLQRQLGTGKKADTYAGMGFDRGLTVGLRAQLSALAGYDDTITAVGIRLDFAQTTLARISEIGRAVKSASQQGAEIKSSGQTAVQENARNQLDELLQLLNTQAGDRYLFAGRNVDGAPVASTDHVLDGDGARAGLRQLIAERAQADGGADGLGRLVIPAAAGSTVTVTEDVAGSPFGLKLAGIASTLTGASVSGPGGSPPGVAITLGAGNPNAGEKITLTLTLPDGTAQVLTLEATAASPPAAGRFTIGATPAVTAGNLQTALAGAIAHVADTSLAAASALAASDNFFRIDAGHPPQRVAGPPFATATALVAGTAADTVMWYTGEIGSDPARASACARVDSSITVSYGLRANEQGLRWLVQNVAALAAVTFPPADPAAGERYGALAARVTTALNVPDGVQRVEDVAADLGGLQMTLKAARERQQQVRSALGGLLEQVEGVPPEEAGAQILALQTRLQASLQTTAKLYQISLINYL